LIALDFDSSSQKVAEVGFKMAKTMGAKVVLFHVKNNLVNFSLTYKKMKSLRLNSVEDTNLAVQNFLKILKHQPGDNLIQTIVKEGDFAVSILDAAKEMAVDIIVMGSDNTKWVEEIVMGRVTNKVLQQSKIPLLIIPIGKRDKTNTFIFLEQQMV